MLCSTLMDLEVRPVADDELVAYLDALSTAFLERPDIEKVAEEIRPNWDLGRAWAAVDGTRICGTFRTWATELTVPGGARLPTAAVTAVTVRPTHRRRGILRRMVAAEHRALRERGEIVALLYASEYPIYGRFGYGPATRLATWTLDALATGFHGPVPEGVDHVYPASEARDAMIHVFDRWRTGQAGEIRRRDLSWAYDLGRETAWGKRWTGFVVLHRAASGEVDGYVRYHTEEKWERRQPRNVLVVDELHAVTVQAYAALWRFIAEIDLVATIRAEGRSPSERLPWLLTNARALTVSDLGDATWVRLFDLPRALEARAYEREARLVLEVIDAEAPGGRLRLELDAGPGGSRCRTTERSPDLTLDVAAVGGAFLGGTPLRVAVLARGVDEHRDGALADADALFRTLDEPWCSTFF
jgi:predicted acetyltransferase